MFYFDFKAFKRNSRWPSGLVTSLAFTLLAGCQGPRLLHNSSAGALEAGGPGLSIEVGGLYLDPRNETLSINGDFQKLSTQKNYKIVFKQYIEFGTLLKIETDSKDATFSENKIELPLPQDLRSGLTFVSIQLAEENSNEEPLKVDGPDIGGGTLSSISNSLRSNLRAGSLAKIEGDLGGVKELLLICRGDFKKQKLKIERQNLNSITFKVPDNVFSGESCAVSILSERESQPIYFKVADATNRANEDVGVYHFGSDLPQSQVPGRSNLDLAVLKAVQAGFTTLRLYMGGDALQNGLNLYGFKSVPKTLVELAEREDFVRAFEKPEIKTFFLTTYSLANYNQLRGASWTAESNFEKIRAAEFNEFKNLASYLGTTYPTKNFVILDWEGDNAFAEYVAQKQDLSKFGQNEIDRLFSNYADWVKNRALAIKAAGAKNVKAGAEFNLVWRSILNQYSQITSLKCQTVRFKGSILESVIPKVIDHLDVISFSSYDMINNPIYDNIERNYGSCPGLGLPQSPILYENYDVEKQVRLALDYLSNRFPKTQVIIGEFGFKDGLFEPANGGMEYKGLSGPSANVRAASEVVSAASSYGATSIYWQLFPNPSSYVGNLGYGIFDNQFNSRLGGETLKFFSGQVHWENLKQRLSQVAGRAAAPFDVWNYYLKLLTTIPGPDPREINLAEENRFKNMTLDDWWSGLAQSAWSKWAGLHIEEPQPSVASLKAKNLLQDIERLGGQKYFNFFQWNFFFEKVTGIAGPSHDEAGLTLEEALRPVTVQSWWRLVSSISGWI